MASTSTPAGSGVADVGWSPVAPSDGSVDDLRLEEWVFQALGSASMWWEDPAGAGEFDGRRCEAIGNALMAHLNQLIEQARAG